MTALYSLGSVVAVSLVSLVGLFTLTMSEERVGRLATFFVSFAVGALLGDAFIHLLPEIFVDAGEHGDGLRASLLVLGGMMLFFVVEKLLRHSHGVLYQHAHGGHDHGHGHVPPGQPGPRPALAAINIFGDAIHNFIDGVIIGVSYLASPTLGVTTTLAVLLHEIPQELSDFAILVHSGLTRRRALLVNLATASAAVLGTVLALVAGHALGGAVVEVMLPITAGGFVYIACADLVPELQHDHSLRALLTQVGFIGVGIAVMGLLTLVE